MTSSFSRDKSINPPAQRPLFCADIGGSFIKFALSPALGELSQVERLPMPINDFQAFINALAGLMEPYSLPAGIPLSLSTAGLVSPQTGEVMAANIPCFRGRALAAELTLALGRPVTVANDADCFTLAEAHLGSGRDRPVVLGVILGTGVGGGLVINGRPVRGQGGVCGEWGHGAIVPTEVMLDGEPRHIPRLACGCGQTGCVDTIGGARGLERLHLLLHGISQDSRTLLQAWHRGEERARTTLSAWLTLLGEPLALAVNIVGASAVAVGGGLASEPQLIAALDQRVRAGVLHAYNEPLVMPGRFATDGGLIGASIAGWQFAGDEGHSVFL